jgi:carbonic anhydrase
MSLDWGDEHPRPTDNPLHHDSTEVSVVEAAAAHPSEPAQPAASVYAKPSLLASTPSLLRARTLACLRVPACVASVGCLFGMLLTTIIVLISLAASFRPSPGPASAVYSDARFPYNATADLDYGWSYVEDPLLWDTATLGPLLGPSRWPSLPSFPRCADALQSPIALADISATPAGAPQKLQRRYNSTLFRIGPREGKPGFELDPRAVDISGELWLLGGTRYNFVDFHCHAPSEHTVNGEQFALEVHFLHMSAAGASAVFALLFREDKERQRPNPYLRAFWSDIFFPEDALVDTPLNLTAFVDDIAAPPVAYTYTGTLTTPPCTPATWWVAVSKSMVNREQLAAFSARMQLVSTNRPVQSTQGRAVSRVSLGPGPVSNPDF